MISPLALKHLGYLGNYGISAAILTLGIVYLLAFVKEPIVKKSGNRNGKSFIYVAFTAPILGMKSLFLKKRKTVLKILILLQLFCFVIYWLVIETTVVKYLYMLLVFDGFTETQFSYYSVFYNLRLVLLHTKPSTIAAFTMLELINFTLLLWS